MKKTTRARKAAQLCPGCNGDFNAPGIKPSPRTPGMCADCAPASVTHLTTPGTHHTFCGKPTRDLDTADTAQQHDPLFGSTADVNCPGCLDVLCQR